MEAEPLATSTGVPPSLSARAKPAARHLLDGAAIVIALVAVVAAFWFVHRFALNMVYFDQWTDINLIMHARTGTFSLGTLWAQHNENRILFPNLIVLFLASTTHFDVVFEDYASALCSCMATFLLVAAHKRRSPSIPWILYCPVIIVLLAFIPFDDTLFGEQIGWFLAIAGLASSLFFLDRLEPTRLTLVLATMSGVIGSYSSVEGLFIWPAGLVLLYLRRRSRSTYLTWIIAGLVTGIVYFIDFNFAAAGGNKSYVLDHPLTAIRFFVSSMGNVVGMSYPNNSPTTGNTGVLVLGILVLGIALVALVRSLGRDRSDGSPIGVALICFGLLFIAFITLGRTQLGLAAAERYSIFVLLIWIGDYLALIDASVASKEVWLARLDRWAGVTARGPEGEARREVGRLSLMQMLSILSVVVLLGILTFQVVDGDAAAMNYAGGWRSHEFTVADVTANIGHAPDSLVESQLGAYPASYIRPLASYAASQHLSLFDTPLATEDRDRGLFPALLTQIIIPKDGASLSGTELLDAEAVTTDDTSVQFRISGPTLGHALTISSTKTLYGWFSFWKTTEVPNGSYQLQIVLLRDRGASTVGLPITVIVQNHR